MSLDFLKPQKTNAEKIDDIAKEAYFLRIVMGGIQRQVVGIARLLNIDPKDLAEKIHDFAGDTEYRNKLAEIEQDILKKRAETNKTSTNEPTTESKPNSEKDTTVNA